MKYTVVSATITNPFSKSFSYFTRWWCMISRHLKRQWHAFMHFYETVYLPDHAAPLNRWVHFLSNVSALLFCGLGVWYWNIYLFVFGVWFQLGPPYLGHILFEKTHRSIDQSPIYAALGSWYTTLQIFMLRQSVTHGPKSKDGE